MNPRDLASWQHARALTGVQMAELLAISRVTYSRWVHGHQPIAHWAVAVLEFWARRYPEKLSAAATTKHGRK